MTVNSSRPSFRNDSIALQKNITARRPQSRPFRSSITESPAPPLFQLRSGTGGDHQSVLAVPIRPRARRHLAAPWPRRDSASPCREDQSLSADAESRCSLTKERAGPATTDRPRTRYALGEEVDQRLGDDGDAVDRFQFAARLGGRRRPRCDIGTCSTVRTLDRSRAVTAPTWRMPSPNRKRAGSVCAWPQSREQIGRPYRRFLRRATAPRQRRCRRGRGSAVMEEILDLLEAQPSMSSARG